MFTLLRLWYTYNNNNNTYAEHTAAHRVNDRVYANDEVTEFGVPVSNPFVE